MTWPWQRRPAPPVEKRQAGGAGFTEAVTRALVDQAAGRTVATATATAALEAAAGCYQRAFMAAMIEPASMATAALTPAIRGLLARDLIRRGEAVHVIDVDQAGRLTLTPAGSWDVRGDANPGAWWYRLDVFGPTGTVTRYLPSAAVVHARYSIDPARPWFGIGPMGWASLTGRLLAEIEAALADEAAGTRGHVLPMPQGPDGDGDADNTEDPQAQLRRDIAGLRGKTVLVETTAGGWTEGRIAAPQADWKPQRIGANPPASLGMLRSETGLAVLAACGVPIDLLAPNAASQRRESWRQFLHGSVQPVAELLAAELAAKLDTPGLRFNFDTLMASDLSGRARALGSMVKAGVPLADARRLAGLE